MTTFKIYNDDCRKALKNLAENSIDSIITDPPYELGFMRNAWDKSGIAYNRVVWKECLRVLKPGGHLLAFSSPRTQHRMICAIEDAGFEIRDQIMWIYSSGMPKGKKISNACRSGKNKSINGEWQTALKPAHEPICMARKPFNGTVCDNFYTHGTGALNIEACRIPVNVTQNGSSIKADRQGGDANSNYSHECAALTTKGRFPANILHDGDEEVVSLFPASKGQIAPTRGDGAPMKNKIYGAMKHGSVTSNPRADSGSAARFYYCAKASKSDRQEGLVALDADRKNSHPTVKPVRLMRYLCQLVTPLGGTVLDPFMGSGSTGKAAMLEGMGFIGIEVSEEYAQIAEARISWAQNVREAEIDNKTLDYDF